MEARGSRVSKGWEEKPCQSARKVRYLRAAFFSSGSPAADQRRVAAMPSISMSMKVSATWSETPAKPERLAPRLSEHAEEVLREAGFSDSEIASLVRDGVTRLAPPIQD